MQLNQSSLDTYLLEVQSLSLSEHGLYIQCISKILIHHLRNTHVTNVDAVNLRIAALKKMLKAHEDVLSSKRLSSHLFS